MNRKQVAKITYLVFISRTQLSDVSFQLDRIDMSAFTQLKWMNGIQLKQAQRMCTLMGLEPIDVYNKLLECN